MYNPFDTVFAEYTFKEIEELLAKIIINSNKLFKSSDNIEEISAATKISDGTKTHITRSGHMDIAGVEVVCYSNVHEKYFSICITFDKRLFLVIQDAPRYEVFRTSTARDIMILLDQYAIAEQMH